MKHWFNKNYKTLIIAAFLIPILTVAVVSISHVTQWYGISNPITWATYLSVGIEIAALSALAAISANMGSKVYFPFAIVTLVQFIGNIFFAYSFIDINSKSFKDWVDLVSPLVEFLGVDPNDFVGHKRFLALFAGGMLPLISLSFLHMLVKFTEEDRNNEEKLIIEEERHLIDDKIIEEAIEKYKKEQEQSKPDDLKEFVDESTRIRLSDEDLKILENALLNPPKPNEKLVEAAKNYKESTQTTDVIDTPQTEKTQLQKLEEYVNPIEDVQIESAPIEEQIVETSPIIETPTPEFEIPEQEGWTEEIEQQFWIEQPIEPFVTPEEVEKFKIDSKSINQTLDEVNQEIDNQPQPTQTITVTFNEDDLKPFDVDLKVEESEVEQNSPSFEITAEKKNL